MMILKLCTATRCDEKRRQLRMMSPIHIVIGADTIVVHEGKLYSKPESKEQASKHF